MSTAVSVPSWVTAVNAAPASLPKKNAEVMRRCADEETGRNSVSPCTMPEDHGLEPAHRGTHLHGHGR